MAPDVYHRIIEAKQYIDSHFDEPICLDHICRAACFSRFHFHRLFSRIYRKTPHQYLTLKRIEQAKRLLGNQDLKVHEICHAVGFESIGSFSGLFKKEIGITPVGYRHRLIRRRKETIESPGNFIPGCFASFYALNNSNIQESFFQVVH